MPGGDRTGHMGMGVMSGRAAGYCAGFGMPGYVNPAPRRGFGIGLGRGSWGRGGGRGWRHRFYTSGLPAWMRYAGYPAPAGYPTPFQKPDPDLEKQALKNEAEALRSELTFIEKRLSEIETRTAAQQKTGE